jgi:6-phosphogluconolactonase
MTAAPRVVIHPDRQTLADAAGARLLVAIVDAQAAHDGPVHLVLTGGSMGSAILASLGRCPGAGAIEWGRVNLWWGDERYLPAGDPERNQTQNGAALLDTAPVPPANIHPVLGPDATAGAEEAAAAYADALALAAGAPGGVPAFDVVMLGVGPDGHVASLFPGHPGLAATGSTAAVHDSPKPPPDRVTLTLDTLRRGRRVWFLVAGPDKADAVRRGTGPVDIDVTPATGVHGTVETLWLVDRDAAGATG